MESSSVSQKLRCSEFTLELLRALVVSEGDTSTLESDSPFWEAHVACAGEMDAGSILVTRGSEIVHLQSWLMRSGLLASLGGVETSKEERVLHSKLKGPFPTACKKHRCWTLTWPPTGFWFKSCPLYPAALLDVFHIPQTCPCPLNYHFLIAGELKYMEAQEILENYCFGLLSHPVQSL